MREREGGKTWVGYRIQNSKRRMSSGDEGENDLDGMSKHTWAETDRVECRDGWEDEKREREALMHLSMSYELSEPSLTLAHKYLCKKCSRGEAETHKDTTDHWSTKIHSIRNLHWVTYDWHFYTQNWFYHLFLL